MLFSTHAYTATNLMWGLYWADCTPVVVGDASSTSDLKYLPLCKKYYPFPGGAVQGFDPALVDVLRKVVRDEAIDIIMPGCFETLEYLSQYHTEISDFIRVMPLPPRSTIRLLHDKHSFSLFCRDNGIPHPGCLLLRDRSDLREADMPLSFPLLTKPLEFSASEGIYRFDDFRSLSSHLSCEPKKKCDEFPILLQEFIPGADIDFNGFALDGRLCAWTTQRWIQVPHGDGKPYVWLQFEDNPEVVAIGSRIAEASRFSGPFHVDLRMDARNGQIFALETNPRFWGSVLASMNGGVNFAEVAVRAAFEPGFLQGPRPFSTIWGNPVKALVLALWKRDGDSRRIASRHTWFQMKYLLMDRTSRLISMGRKGWEHFAACGRV